MCTVSVIATPAGYRLVHSRDEQRTRGAGEPPSVRFEAGVRVVSPSDPDAGGTWLAAREDGLTLAIMNVNPEGGGPRGTRSRGLIARDLSPVDQEDLVEAVRGIECGLYSPFRLVGVRTAGVGVRVDTWTWHGEGRLEHERVGLPVCWGTSGLGDSVVRARLPLFEKMVSDEPTAANQDAYHRHAWPGRGDESVMMSRADARTVSITSVETISAGVRMTYTEIPDEGGVGVESLEPAEVITLG